jgi:AraC-like DNA-binding protein
MQPNYHGVSLLWANRRVHTANVVFGEVAYRPGGYCGPRRQQHYELVMFHSGDCEVSVDAEVRKLGLGNVYLFLPGRREHFRFSIERETHHSYCTIKPAFVPAGLRERLERALFAVPCSEVCKLLVTTAFKLRMHRAGPAQGVIEHLALSWFSEFLNAAYEQNDSPGYDVAVETFLRFVEEHFGEEDCLEAARRATGLSRNTLIYKVRRQFATTPGRYLWKLRTERGVAMLAETGHSVAEIAYKCGFKTPFHFSRMVSRQQGLCPKMIRRRIWGAGEV